MISSASTSNPHSPLLRLTLALLLGETREWTCVTEMNAQNVEDPSLMVAEMMSDVNRAASPGMSLRMQTRTGRCRKGNKPFRYPQG
jgi:hypothetical protein